MKMIPVVSVLVMLAGCATVLPLQVTGGSKADGTVLMTSQYNNGFALRPNSLMTEPVRHDAARRCREWGYADALAPAVARQRCETSVGPCEVSAIYQCTGGIAKP